MTSRLFLDKRICEHIEGVGCKFCDTYGKSDVCAEEEARWPFPEPKEPNDPWPGWIPF